MRTPSSLRRLPVSVWLLAGGLALSVAAQDPTNSTAAESAFRRGVASDNGKGVPRDAAEAVRQYRVAAELGHPRAQNYLGQHYYSGTGVGKDAAEAVKWFRKAAQAGDAKAQYNLAVCLEKGDGVSKDGAEAVRWYRKAAAAGDASAQFNLAFKYWRGEDASKDEAEAARLYLAAAQQGHSRAQLVIARMYANGQGVAKDPALARKFYREAAAQGVEQAKTELAKLESAPADGAGGGEISRPGDQGGASAESSNSLLGGGARQKARDRQRGVPQGGPNAPPTVTTGRPARSGTGVDDAGASSRKPASPAIPRTQKEARTPVLAERPAVNMPAIELPSELRRPEDLTPSPCLLRDLLDVDALSGSRPGGDVLATKALLRLLAGPMTPEQTERLDRQTAADYANPTESVATRHRSANRQLVEALAERQLMIQALREREAAMREAAMMRYLKDLQAEQTALELAKAQAQMLDDATRRLASLSEEADREESNTQRPPPEAPPAITGNAEYQQNCRVVKAVGEAQLDRSATWDGYLGRWILEQTAFKAEKNTEDFKVKQSGSGLSVEARRRPTGAGGKMTPGTMVFRGEFTWEAPPRELWVYDGEQASQRGTQKVHDRASIALRAQDAGSEIEPVVMDHPLEQRVEGAVFLRTFIVAGEGSSAVQLYYWDYYGRKAYEARVCKSNRATNSVASASATCPVAMPPPSRDPYNGKTIPPSEQKLVHRVMTPGGNADFIYRWEASPTAPAALAALPEFKVDENLDQQTKDAIAEHLANIRVAQQAIESIRRELEAEKDLQRANQLRFNLVHLEQDVHDSKDSIESIRTGRIVHTRGPWEQHAEAVAVQAAARMSQKAEEAHQMQATARRLAGVLAQYSPEEAKKAHQLIGDAISTVMFDNQHSMDRAKDALKNIHEVAKAYCLRAQAERETDQTIAAVQAAQAARNLEYVESLKRNADRAIFVGTMLTPIGPGAALALAYEGATVSIEKGPAAGLKQVAKDAALMVAMAGAMKGGESIVGKFLNPKVAGASDDIFAAAKFEQEAAWNRELVGRVMETQTAVERARQAGSATAAELAKLEAAAADAVSAANSSAVAKRLMKNELWEAEQSVCQVRRQMRMSVGNPEAAKVLAETERQALARLRAVENMQGNFDKTVRSIYAKTDDLLVNDLKRQGYNVERDWFIEYRNSSSRGVNADRDLGLLAKYEASLAKGGKPVTLEQFMKDAQRAYDAAYRSVNNKRSAKLADQSITTSAHSESFPLEFLDSSKIGSATSDSCKQAGQAIYNKVQNALNSGDPAVVNLQKACASLSKDMNTKVFKRLQAAQPAGVVTGTDLEHAREYWEQVNRVMENFAHGRIDPLTATRQMRQLTGGKTMTQVAEDAKKLMASLGE